MSNHDCPSRVKFAGIEHVCICAKPAEPVIIEHHELCLFTQPWPGSNGRECFVCATIERVKADIVTRVQAMPYRLAAASHDETYELVTLIDRAAVVEVVLNV